MIGFEWFEYEGVVYEPNPAAEVAQSLDSARIGDAIVEGITVPVSREGILEAREALERGNAACAVGLGLYTPGTPQLRVEVAAVNALLVNGSLEPVDPRRPLYEPAAIPVDPLELTKGLPARPSLSTGLYYCNALAYTLYTWSRETRKPTVFIHLPYTTTLAERLGIERHAQPLHQLVDTVYEIAARLTRRTRGNKPNHY